MEWIIIGFVLGVFAVLLLDKVMRKPIGTLRIDHSNPEKDTYRFEINNLDALSNKKRIVLKIDNNADLSQK